MDRPLSDYQKVQKLYSTFIRNKTFQVRKLRSKNKTYLNIGCGKKFYEGFIQLDYRWTPGIDLCWDVTKGLPFGKNALKAVYSEHCLEHLPYAEGKKLLETIFGILEPKGLLRLVVPDGELYLQLYCQSEDGDYSQFPNAKNEPDDTTRMVLVNRIFRYYGHQFIYDFDTLKKMLHHIGFAEITKVSYRQGSNPDLLIDSESRMPESPYVEAIKPG